MRRSYLTLVAGIVGASVAGAQAPAQCSVPDRLSLDSLRSIAVRLYPAATTQEQRASYSVVTLVFDSSCKLIHHAMRQRRGPNTLSTDARGLPQYRWASGGTTELLRLTPDEEAANKRSPLVFDSGRPLLTWMIADVQR